MLYRKMHFSKVVNVSNLIFSPDGVGGASLVNHPK